MRKNTREVFHSWRKNRKRKFCVSIWTDGFRIFSYGTILLEKKKDVIYFNTTKYSPTTSNHQGSLLYLLNITYILNKEDCPSIYGHYKLKVYDDLPRSTFYFIDKEN